MKLNKDNRPKFTVKSMFTIGILLVIIAVSSMSIANSDKLLFLENNPVAEVFFGIGKHTNNAISSLASLIGDLFSFKSNADRVRQLSDENKKLKQKLIDKNSDISKTESLNKLKNALNFVQGDTKNKLVSASIVGKNDGDWYQSFIIDAGADSGIKTDSIVINGDGVVGIVYSVGNRYSKAISLVDSRASVSFKLDGKDGEKGVITTSSAVGNSDLTDVNKLLRGYLFDSNAKVKLGDTIVTSGLGLYPENIPIGKITKLIDDKSKSMKIIEVKPFVDFKSLDEVSIIPPRKLD